MSKSIYLDEEKTILCTANNLYKLSLKVYNETQMLKEERGLTPAIEAIYITSRSQLTKALLFGKIEACAGLALYNQQGIGGSASPYNQKLFLTIGSKLGDQACKKGLTLLQNNNLNVEQEANIWVNHINKYKRGLDEVIQIEEISTSSIFLENDLKKYGVDLDAYNSHFRIYKANEEIAADHNYTPPPQPKQTAGYGDPHYNKNTTGTTYEQPKYAPAPSPKPVYNYNNIAKPPIYNYPEQPKYSSNNPTYYAAPAQPPQVYVVKTGGNAPDVHKCEIL